MPVFKYKATSPDKRKLSGVIEAMNYNLAMSALKERGLMVSSLKEKSKEIEINIEFLDNLIRVGAKDLVVFSRQFAVLISASVSMVQALKILIIQTENRKLKKVITEVANEIDGGARLSDSLAKRSNIFSSFYINVIRAGESSGKLDETLNYLADEVEKDYDMISKIRGAMIYPAFVTLGMVGVGVFMMVFIVPKLTGMLAETGQELPVATKILMAASDILLGYWYMIIMAVVGLIVGFRVIYKTAQGKLIIDTLSLKVPVFGKLFQRIYMVRFTRSLETLLIGGVNMSKALNITAEVVSNQVYKDLILETKRRVEDGDSISSVFVTSENIPKMVSQMLGIGEKTGKLDTILDRITIFYSREIDNIVANLMTLMEPIIMVVMGVGVGLMVAAIIMPMYNMAA